MMNVIAFGRYWQRPEIEDRRDTGSAEKPRAEIVVRRLRIDGAVIVIFERPRCRDVMAQDKSEICQHWQQSPAPISEGGEPECIYLGHI
jgi:hypothetical protein